MHHFFGVILNNTTKCLRGAELLALARRAHLSSPLVLIALGSTSYISDTLDTEVSEYGVCLFEMDYQWGDYE